jgi:hypothetical protein
LYLSPTCDTRPFQISAFFFNPHGACPSLKFQPSRQGGCGCQRRLQWHGKDCETTVFDREVELVLGDTKADEHANRAVTSSRMDLVNIIFFFRLTMRICIWYPYGVVVVVVVFVSQGVVQVQ